MKKLVSSLLVLGLSLAAATSQAHVTTAGDWSKEDKPVTVNIDAPRAEAVKKLAEAAGWNIVVPDKLGGGAENLQVAVKDESPLAVLEALLESGDFTATRHGKLVVVSDTRNVAAAKDASNAADASDAKDANNTNKDAEPPTAAAVPAVPVPPVPPSIALSAGAVPPAPPAPPAATSEEAGEDKSVMGGNAVVAKDERVHNVSVMGGNLDVLGVVTGDMNVVGGHATVKDGAHVMGDAVAVGGALEIEKGARVDGDVGVIGGVLQRHEGAIIRGKTVSNGDKRTDGDDGVESSSGHRGGKDKIRHGLSGVGSAVTRSAMLFVFGVVLLSFFKKRYDGMKLDIAQNPVKAFGTGMLALFISIVATVVLCITVIGIPLVVIGWLFAALCIYGGIVSVLTLAGELMLRHKTQNPYAHLALGCAAYLVLGAIPVVGGIVTALVFFIALGSVLRTRAGGLFAKEPKGAVA